MASINSLIVGSSAHALHLDNAVNVQGAQKIAALPESSPPPRDIVFERGQWWRNSVARNKQVTAAEAGKCGCQACTACAAQAYQVQAEQASYFTLNREDGGGRSAGQQRPFGDPSADTAQTEAGRQESREEEAKSGESTVKTPDGRPLTQDEKLELTKLQQIDTQVRAHEMAHLAAAGPYARSGASFQYQRGPDGKNYAVAGEVQIDTSRESTPEATIRKMRVVRAAALAPADPSPQDRKVAASATMAIGGAIQELRRLTLKQGQAERQQAVSETEKASGSSGEDIGVENQRRLYPGNYRTRAPESRAASAIPASSTAEQVYNSPHQNRGVSIIV